VGCRRVVSQALDSFMAQFGPKKGPTGLEQLQQRLAAIYTGTPPDPACLPACLPARGPERDVGIGYACLLCLAVSAPFSLLPCSLTHPWSIVPLDATADPGGERGPGSVPSQGGGGPRLDDRLPLPQRLAALQRRAGHGHGDLFAIEPDSRLLPDISRNIADISRGALPGAYVPGLIEVLPPSPLHSGLALGGVLY